MASEIDICNLALAHVGGRAIESFTEGTKEAIECRRFYEIDRNAVLEDHDWNFARKRLSLALLTEEYSGWEYAYAWPTDCLAPRVIYNPAGWDAEEIRFEVASDSTGSQRVILTDQAEAELIYTMKVTVVNLYDNQFIQALALRLASDLAQTIRAKPELRVMLLKDYDVELGKVKTKQSNEGYTPNDSLGAFVDSRN